MTIKLSPQAINDLLKKNQYNPLHQAETDQTYILMEFSRFQIPVFFGIRTENNLLQLIAYLPYETQESTLGQTARLLHMLNKELDMPGFCLDETHKLLFYRVVIPCLDGQLEPQLFDAALKAIKFICENFVDAISLIVQGKTTIEEVAKRSNQPPTP